MSAHELFGVSAALRHAALRCPACTRRPCWVRSDPGDRDAAPPSTCSQLPAGGHRRLPADLQAGGLGAFDVGDPTQQICAVAVGGRDFWGAPAGPPPPGPGPRRASPPCYQSVMCTAQAFASCPPARPPPPPAGIHQSATNACLYSAKAPGGALAEQGAAATEEGAAEPAYRCACVWEEDRKRAGWKDALAWPASYAPFGEDVNMCRVDMERQGGHRAQRGLDRDGCAGALVITTPLFGAR